MALAATATWRRAGTTKDDTVKPCPTPELRRVLLAATGVGVMTGFFGVGGGFLIVPVLTLRLNMCLRRAVATSLVIITLTGLVALASHVVADSSLNLSLTASLAGATAIGAVAGTMVGRRLPQAILGRAFAVVVLSVAVFLLVDTLLLGGPPAA